MLWAPRAWLRGRWADSVLLTAGSDGCWSEVRESVDAVPAAARHLDGPVLPGVVNAHSHAFQRAFAGLSERRTGPDDFWSWRERMYGVGNRITPAQLRAIARQLYAELLLGGYTQVCEFHYLQHDRDGRPYTERFAMIDALVAAAEETGIGLTVLPVLYERSGFAQAGLHAGQRRFAAGVDTVIEGVRHVESLAVPRVSAGVAVPSLRAAEPDSIRRLLTHIDGRRLPVHIHVAEQTAEVDECLATTGRRPIEWLAAGGLLDSRWQLVHATHATPREIEAVATHGAGVVYCPTTEADLGDGVPDLAGWLAAGVPAAIGSDSHVSRSLARELRLLDYAQRLVLRRRNVGSDPAYAAGSSAGRLFDLALSGGAAAAGLGDSGLVPGARADLLVLDDRLPGLAGVPADYHLDALVYAVDGPALREVWVAGRRVVADGEHHAAATIAADFATAMAEIWSG